MFQHVLITFDGQEFLALKQTAKLLGVSEPSVRRLMEQGLLPGYKIFRSLRFSKTDILAFVGRQQIETTPPHPYGRSQD